ncbi:MAG: hypothetical protein ACREVW_18360 [Burkholderiales bacterium]
MIDVAALIILTVLAIRISSSVSREAKIFEEFGQSKVLSLVAFLFPIAPLELTRFPGHI